MKKLLLLAVSLLLVVSAFAQQKATKTITNADVEQFRQKRVQAEEEYRRNHKQMGMPSPEELERRNQESQAWREEFSRRQVQERAQQGGDIAYRANVLRSQIANNAAQINYLRSLLARIPTNSNNVIDVSELNQYILPGVGYQNYGYGSSIRIGVGRRSGFPNRGYRQFPQQVTTPNPAVASALAANNLSAAYNLDPNYLNTQPQRTYGRGRVGRNRPYYYPGYIYPYPIPVNNNNRIQREDIVARVRVLEQERAGLLAQWNVLEDEARNAGVKIN